MVESFLFANFHIKMMQICLFIFALISVAYPQQFNTEGNYRFDREIINGKPPQNEYVRRANQQSGIRRIYNNDDNQYAEDMNDDENVKLKNSAKMYPAEIPSVISAVIQITNSRESPEIIRQQLNLDNLVSKYGKGILKDLQVALRSCSGATVASIAAHFDIKGDNIQGVAQKLRNAGLPLCRNLLDVIVKAKSNAEKSLQIRGLFDELDSCIEDLRIPVRSINNAMDQTWADMKLTTLGVLGSMMRASVDVCGN